jgi:2-keto-myo-inositol isomerase
MQDVHFGLCLNTSTIRCGELTLEEKIDVTASAGYDGIEPWIRELDAYQSEGGRLGDLAQRTDDAGLKVANLIGFFDWAVEDDAQRREGFEEARRCFHTAQELACPFVAAPPYGATEVRGLDLFPIAERYAELVDVGREFGVVPLLEYWGHSHTLGHLGEALLVLSECNRTEARLLADIFHTYKGSGHLDGFRLLGAASLGLLHINDYPADPPRESIRDGDRVYPADGVAPLPDVLRGLAAAGYCGMLSLELFSESYWAQDALTVARTGMAKLRAVVDSALAAP